MMMNRGRTASIALVLASIAATSRSPATVVAPMTLEEIVRAADRILIATVAEARCEPSIGDRSIDTVFVLEDLRSLKGAPLAGATYSFRQRGGRIGDRRVLFPGAPQLLAGARCILFLHEDGRILSPIVGLRLGCFRIIDGHIADDAGNPVVGIRAGRPVVRVAPEPAESPLAADAFVAHIQGIIAAQALDAEQPETGGEVPR
ncbi:MAG: hypothetical protein JXP34_09735 [Planctomycetes bacterium]|nr:hypothetical protein [Planctomycetota bacterium]